MLDDKTLTRILTGVAKTGKYVAGYKEVSRSVKGSKVIIASSTLEDVEAKTLQNATVAASIPFLQVTQTSIGLGKALGRHFKVSALAVKNQGDANLTPILEAIPK